MLPWPSNTYAVRDDGTETGLRLDLAPVGLLSGEAVHLLNQADGFSRVSSVMTAFSGRLDPARAEGAVLLINAQPDHPDYGTVVPVRTEVVSDDENSFSPTDLLMAHPNAPLAFGADYVVAITDEIGVEADRAALVSIGMSASGSAEEDALAAYHAPTRMLLDDIGLDLGSVVRIWDFTTRSAADPTWRLAAMVDGMAGAELSFTVDTVEPSSSDVIEAILLGRLGGVPDFIGADGYLSVSEDGTPVAVGVRDVEVRLVLPVGGGRPVLYGHSLGGDVTDSTFDVDMAAQGALKVNLQFDGWGGTEVINTFLAMSGGVDAAAGVAHLQLQSLANSAAVLDALNSHIADAVEAEVGWRPEPSPVFYIGGSLGGSSGALLIPAIDAIDSGVLNVPGASWSQMAAESEYYDLYLDTLIENAFGDLFEGRRSLAMAQNVLDEMDGASWGGRASEKVILIQESIGDPIMPNTSTGMLAQSREASQLGAVLTDYSLQDAPPVVTEGTVLTQYRTEGSSFAVHGFAGRSDDAAGIAARTQIFDLLTAVWAGIPQISLPAECQDNSGSCDFVGR